MPATPIGELELKPERVTREEVEQIIEQLSGMELSDDAVIGISRDGGFEGEIGFGNIEVLRVEENMELNND